MFAIFFSSFLWHTYIWSITFSRFNGYYHITINKYSNRPLFIFHPYSKYELVEAFQNKPGNNVENIWLFEYFKTKAFN